MALVSPGVQISINDQSQYVPNQVGSVPLVLLATAQDKTYNGAAATGTSKANAGKLQVFTSQRDLVTAMGTPTFQLSSAGTPVIAAEINEYGLMAAYSALGLGNQLYAIRADIDLNQLKGTSVRPVGMPASGTYWMDTANTEYGIYELNREGQEPGFIHVDPVAITSKSYVEVDPFGYYNSYDTNNKPCYPKKSVGTIGEYALVFVRSNGATATVVRTFYKAGPISVRVTGHEGTESVTTAGTLQNYWVEIGSPDWQRSYPVASVTVAAGATVPSSGVYMTINGTDFNTSDVGGLVGGSTFTVADLVSVIRAKRIPGVWVMSDPTSNTTMHIFSTNYADSQGNLSNGHVRDAAVKISGTICNPNKLNVNSGSVYYSPYLHYGSYATEPTDTNGNRTGWGLSTADTKPRPSGSLWWKTTATGGGWNPVFKKYNSSTDEWTTLAVPMYQNYSTAIYDLDPIGGGIDIPHGEAIATFQVSDRSYNNLRFADQFPRTTATATGAAVDVTGLQAQAGSTFLIGATRPGYNGVFASPDGSGNNRYVVTIGGSDTTENIVQKILNLGVPYVTASVSTVGDYSYITITHTTGGQISLTPNYSNGSTNYELMNYLGFGAGADPTDVGNGYLVNIITGAVTITNWESITEHLVHSASLPFSNPADGTHWYYSNPVDVDIMINTGSSWSGYRVAGVDTRSYDLTTTDVNGVIVSATAPTSHTDATMLEAGDLWLDSSDLVNYPKLSRYNGMMWVAIDNTDHVSSNGIIFADARWDLDGTRDPVTGDLVSTRELLSSDYVDADCPDAHLYPRGILLFNTRRSGYNVKKFVSNYFTEANFPILISGRTLPDPSNANAWVSASGLDSKNVMLAGSAAQRSIVVKAIQGAVDSNIDVREDNYNFNLLVAPGYPELIDNLVTLNNDRANTGFVIGDTPMTMAPNVTEITAWSNNTNGDGLATADPYLGVYYPAGRTNDLAGNTIVVPASHAVLRTFLYNDNVSYQWFAPAGANRGLVSNLSDIGYVNAQTGAFIHNGINQGLRDALYNLEINPITELPGIGLVIWGQETRSGLTTARNRISVVRLENFLRSAFKKVANSYLFEPNDSITRKSIAGQIESTLHDLLSKRGLYDFLVICDTSNNTSSTIANNQLYVDVAIEPMKDVEFIYIPIALYNPGALATLGQRST